MHCNESLIILHLNSYPHTYENKISFLLLYSIDINNKQFVEMKYILPKSGANLVQFSRQSECPLLKCSRMQDSIDGLESLLCFLHVNFFSRNFSIQETRSIGCVGTNLLSRCRCRLKLPLCKVQNLCAEFNRDFCKRLHLRRK